MTKEDEEKRKATAQYKFFMRTYQYFKLVTAYYNGDKSLLGICIAKEAELRAYINEVLNNMRSRGFSDIPDNIPDRSSKYDATKDKYIS